ncbi:MAG TPA: hypothetical protein PK168_02215 [Candidatus Paceibacterota bacterium]|nr:hypothetical protein [Candidatus Paceibacterota bacterium]HPC37449.1 hypothetical protein [Candidatus Paceibacterota bacterium]HRU35892.1 hypothetical protein [Candidatus Paceibacterota bacterium]
MRQCAICGKSYSYSITRKKIRSKYNPVNRKKTKANLQWVFLPDGTRVQACTRCKRTLTKKALTEKTSTKKNRKIKN